MTESQKNEVREEVLLIKKIGNKAIQRAIQSNRAKGIPNAFSRNGILYYEMPDGSIQREIHQSPTE